MLTDIHAIAARLVVLMSLLAVAAGLVIWLTLRAAWLRAARLRGLMRQWAAAGDDDWRRRLVRSLIDPDRPDVPGLVVLGLALIGGLWLFLGVVQDVVSGGPLVRVDRAVFHLLQALRVPVVDQAMVAVTELGDAAVIIPVTLAALAWLVWQRAWRAAFYALASVGGASAFALLLKVTVHQSRPGALYDGWNAYSFPSSHATVSTALFGSLVVLICREVGTRARVAVTLVAIALVGAIAFSRLYLGAHWLSDVIAGLAVGTVWTALLGIVYLRHANTNVEARGLAGVSLAALLAAGSLHIAMAHATDMRRYAVNLPVDHADTDRWPCAGGSTAHSAALAVRGGAVGNCNGAARVEREGRRRDE